MQSPRQRVASERAAGRFQAQVAIKRLSSAGLRAIEARRRVAGEAAHPHFTWLIDAVLVDEAVPYWVLAHAQGVTIERYC